MRVLMRDSQDNSLIAFDAQEVIFDPEDQSIILTAGDLSYVVDKIAQVNADALSLIHISEPTRPY